jgi:hypothetical protein
MIAVVLDEAQSSCCRWWEYIELKIAAVMFESSWFEAVNLAELWPWHF